MTRLLAILPLLFLCYGIAEAAAPDFRGFILFWNRTHIPYKIGDEYNDAQKKEVRAAIQVYMDNTCLDFKENVADGSGQWLQYTLDEGKSCNGGIGRNYYGDNTIVNLQSGCIHSAGIHHETTHAMGFKHEHNRPDRDSFVKVADAVLKNTNYAKNDIFNSTDRFNRPTTDYGIPYEYNSLLHYPSNGNVEPLDKDYLTTFAGDVMLFNDWKVVNMHYKCNEVCPKQITCKNGGYQHPRKCTECVCPQFHKGQFCQEERGVLNLKKGEVKVLHKEWIQDQKTRDANKVEHLDPTKFERTEPLIIKAPEGTRIRVNVVNISDSEASRWFIRNRCDDIGLEIVDRDLTTTGKRFCKVNSTTHSFVSPTNVVGYVVFHSRGHGFAANVTFSVEDSTGPSPSVIAPTTVTPVAKPQVGTTTVAPSTTKAEKWEVVSEITAEEVARQLGVPVDSIKFQ